MGKIRKKRLPSYEADISICFFNDSSRMQTYFYQLLCMKSLGGGRLFVPSVRYVGQGSFEIACPFICGEPDH